MKRVDKMLGRTGGPKKRSTLPTDASQKHSTEHAICSGRVRLKSGVECTVPFVNDTHLAVCFDGEEAWKVSSMEVSEVQEHLYTLVDVKLGEVKLHAKDLFPERMKRLGNKAYQEVLPYAGQMAKVLEVDDGNCLMSVLLGDNHLVRLPWDCVERQHSEKPLFSDVHKFKRGRVKLVADSNQLLRAFCGRQQLDSISYTPTKLVYDGVNGHTWSKQKAAYVGQSGTIVRLGETSDGYYIRFEDGLCWYFPAAAIECQETVDPPFTPETSQTKHL